MLILLPPSETKADGGAGAPLTLSSLWHASTLTRARGELVHTLARISGAEPAAARRALGLGPRGADELTRNTLLMTAPTMPAIERYTGVLYDALDVRSMRADERVRARERLHVASALLGVLRADDHIPAYRLSAGSRLPGEPTLAARWKPLITPLLEHAAREHLVIDLRSGPYRSLAPLPAALTVTVVCEDPDTGARRVVNHHNKHHKGLLARALARTRSEPHTPADVARIARRARLRAALAGERELEIVVASPAPRARS